MALLVKYLKVSFVLISTLGHHDFSRKKEDRRNFCCQSCKFSLPDFRESQSLFVEAITASLSLQLNSYCFVQEKAVKNQKHVMLFWESKLIHKLRGKSKPTLPPSVSLSH
jgi:hypothetical protein